MSGDKRESWRRIHPPERQFMNRNNMIFLLVGALVVAVAATGYQVYQDRKHADLPLILGE